MTKQRKRENTETMSVVKAQVTVYPYMNFPEGTFLKRFTARVIISRSSALALFAITATYLFLKYRL